MADDGNSNDAQDQDTGQGDGQDAGQQHNQAGPRSFTQDELDKIVQDRVARERKKYEGFDDYKAAAGRLAEFEAANQTELEKAQKRAADAEQKAAETAATARQIALEAAIVTEAAKKNVVDPDAVVAMINRQALEFDDNGKPTNVAEAMDSLLKAKPYLVAGAGGARPNGADQGARGGANNQLGREALKTMTPEEITKALQEGRLSGVLGG